MFKRRFVKIRKASSLMPAVAFLCCCWPAQAQTQGRVPIFDSPGTGSCNAGAGNNCVDSVIVQDGSGNIGVGTGSPAARLHVAAGNLYLEDSSPTSGNLLKQGIPFLHNAGPVNTFLGAFAGNFGVTGDTNTGIGYAALNSIADGFSNTAVGGLALSANTSGNTNTAIGRGAMQWNTSGNLNTAVGRSALFNNQAGSDNTAIGVNALQSNIGGGTNVAVG